MIDVIAEKYLWKYITSPVYKSPKKTFILTTFYVLIQVFKFLNNSLWQVLEESEVRAWDLNLAWAAWKGKENFDALPLKHRHLILPNGCSHS